MNCIVAVDENWGIGYKNELLVSIPADMKLFREKTTGNVIIMGRKTLESFPNGLPLKNRVNIMLTKSGEASGASIYEQFLQYVDKAYVTKIDHAYQADTYFPNLDQNDEWEMTEESEEQTYFDLVYTFCVYERKAN